MRNDARKQIHSHLKKASPKAVHKAKRIFRFQYPKFVALIIFIISAYYIFSLPSVTNAISQLKNTNYLGVFVSGILSSFGFTAPFGIGFLININVENIFWASIIGGIGGVVADMLIFKIIRFSFDDELKKLEKTRVIKKIEGIVENNRHVKIKHYLLYLFSGIMIASPLPDEVGVSVLAGLTTVRPLKLAAISFVLHTLAVFAIIHI